MPSKIVTPIIFSLLAKLLIHLGLKTTTRRGPIDSNPFFPEDHPRNPAPGVCPYGLPGDYLRPRGSDLLLKITEIRRTEDDRAPWWIRFERIYP